jgi:hypothetical protein
MTIMAATTKASKIVCVCVVCVYVGFPSSDTLHYYGALSLRDTIPAKLIVCNVCVCPFLYYSGCHGLVSALAVAWAGLGPPMHPPITR